MLKILDARNVWAATPGLLAKALAMIPTFLVKQAQSSMSGVMWILRDWALPLGLIFGHDSRTFVKYKNVLFFLMYKFLRVSLE